jgi:hypothetical protein
VNKGEFFIVSLSQTSRFVGTQYPILTRIAFGSARNVIAALLKRLAHRSPNVQLYALSLGESLSKNCGIDLHRELASRAFTGALEKLIVDRVRAYFCFEIAFEFQFDTTPRYASD